MSSTSDPAGAGASAPPRGTLAHAFARASGQQAAAPAASADGAAPGGGSEADGSSASATPSASSPARISIRVGWVPGKEQEEAITKKTKQHVTVFRDGPPLAYWKREGGLRCEPVMQPSYICVRAFFVLSDGADRWKKGEPDLLCAHCFLMVKSPGTGNSNLKSHLKSCGAAALLAELRGLVVRARYPARDMAMSGAQTYSPGYRSGAAVVPEILRDIATRRCSCPRILRDVASVVISSRNYRDVVACYRNYAGP